MFNQLVRALTPTVSESVTKRADIYSNNDNYVRIRRIQTVLGIGVTLLRAVVVAVVVFYAWRLVNPGSAPFALVGVGTLFVVFAGATLAPLLRDITYGFIMFAERWYNVGDHVVVEPFPHMGGVVERITFRSTKLRSVTGEAIWVHNQHMQAARVTSRASHTIAVETFVNDPKRGQKIIEDAIEIVPTSATTIPGPLGVTEVKKIREGVWRITAICQITPYREWIVEKFALDCIKKTDELDGNHTVVYGPIAYYADTTAENRYRRAVRTRRT